MPSNLRIFSPSVESTPAASLMGDIKAGFPSPANDYLQDSLDLNKHLVTNPGSTFFARVSGDSMIDADLSDGDVLVIDRNLTPASGKIAVCYIDGEFTVKTLKIEKDIVWLLPANDKYQPIKVTPENNFIVWGIVTYVIKKV